MNKRIATRTTHRKIIFPIIGIFVIVLSMAFVLNRTAIRDTLRAHSFAKSPSIIKLEDKLNLTDSALRTFEASLPSLATSDVFNEHCVADDANSAVLGCFTEGKIYIYDIQSADLDGIVESTAAHELLHAAWSRLSGYEKNQLATALEQAYHDNCATLCDTLSTYAADEQLDEIHSRLGTQIADLPPNLERYYSKYFNDRATIVAFYNNYSGVFVELKTKINTLSAELATLKAEIDLQTTDYTAQVETYSVKVKEFNSCAATAGCFTNSTFNSRRANLAVEYDNLEAMFNNLNVMISNYNNKVAEYNNTIIYGRKIENLINSNSAPAEI